MLALLPALRPAQGEAALSAALSGRGALSRWRRHRAAFVLDDAELAAALRTQGGVHVKIYEPKDALETALGIASRDRGATSFRMGVALRARGLPTPEPLLLLLRKPLRVHRETVLVTRGLEAPVLLTDELKRRLAAREPIRPLLDEAARLAATLHHQGFFHGDFTASNLVLAGPAGARSLSLIDLDRARDLRRLPAVVARGIQTLDLRMLLLTSWGEVSRREWLRLLARYARARNLGRGAARRLARRVLSARRGRVRLGAKAPTLGGPAPWPDSR